MIFRDKVADKLIGIIAIAYGVVSDIANPAERGTYIGGVFCGQ